jgi:hypothetical protein
MRVALVTLKNFTGAMQLFDKVLVIYPKQTKALLGKGITLFDEHNDSVAAGISAAAEQCCSVR